MNRTLIGLTGRSKSGKTTLAEHWRETRGFKVISFADALKEAVANALEDNPPPWVRSSTPVGEWGGIYTNRTPFTRWLLQFVGTDIVRNRVSRNHWAERAAQTIYANDGPIVMPDVRFENEAKLIRRLGGDIIKIIRPGGPDIEAGADHQSETEVDNITPDYVCTNDGTLSEFLVRGTYLSTLNTYNE